MGDMGKGMEVLRGIQLVSRAAYKVAHFLGNLILVVMFIFLLVGVFCRYILRSPLGWTDETAQILIVWMAFFGASIGVKERTHVGTEAFLALFPTHVRKIIVIACDCLIAFFSAYLIIFGWKISMVGLGQKTVYWGVTYFWLYLSVAAGGFLLLIQVISLLIDEVQRLRNPEMQYHSERPLRG
jgi:TRAP-type C4-dicarboxylate transport system permease small subunit